MAKETAKNIVDFHQQRGAAMDIIDEAITTYDEWMLDDDYDTAGTLHKIIERMRTRRKRINESK